MSEWKRVRDRTKKLNVEREEQMQMKSNRRRLRGKKRYKKKKV